MGRKRPSPKRLSAKLCQIRQSLKLSQSKMADLIGIDEINASRICEYEHGTRQPHLLALLAYAHVAKIQLEKIVDDNLEI